MGGRGQNRFSGTVSVFHERRLPVTGTPAGYAALIDAYGLSVPLPRMLYAIGERHRFLEEDGWRELAPLPAAREDAAAVTAADGRIFLLGGKTLTGGMTGVTASVMVYDPRRETWIEGD